MSKKRHTKEAQIKAIREHESARSQAEICKELNITAQTFFRRAEQGVRPYLWSAEPKLA